MSSSTPVANIIKKDVEQGFNKLFDAIENYDNESLILNIKRIASAQNYVGFGDYASIKTAQKLFRLGDDKQDTFLFIVAKFIEDKKMKDVIGINIERKHMDLRDNYFINVYDLDKIDFSSHEIEDDIVLITKALRRISRDYRSREVMEYNSIHFSNNMSKIIS